MKNVLAVPLLCTVGLSIPSMTYADYFLEAGVDTTTSVGKFKIKLVDKYAEMLGVKEIVSPRLFDADTKIGRSRPHSDSSRKDQLTGAFICQDGEIDVCFDFFGVHIRDRDFAVIPPVDDIAFEDGPSGTEEIHTQILSLNLTDAGECGTKSANAIRAGSVALDVPRSFGEVESLNPPDNVDSYPAEGFFNLFVEVDVDLNNDGTIDATLFNNYPIVIQNSYEDTFPTDVVYVHDSNNFAVPVYDKVSQTHIGWIIIVGQDIGSGCDDNKIEEGIFDKTPLSVELTSFTAKENEENISLEWKTITEIDCKGYHLWRARKTQAGEYTEITRLTEQLIPSEGGIFGDATYYYEDFGVIPGNNYFYGLEDIANGISTIHLESIISTTGGNTN